MRFFIPVLALAVRYASGQETFVFSVDLLAGPTGYFEVEGYNGIQPDLTIVRGKTYTFDQLDESNWFHPLGFAYYPDGAHEGVDELEEGVGNGDEPLYIINGEESILDVYEPQFFYPEDAWMENEYTVNLTVTDPEVTEIFYFCHIHNQMSGRIFVVDAEGDVPGAAEIELYEPFVSDAFDEECGTFDATDYQPKEGTFESDLCPDQKFLCGDTSSSFDRCMHAIDCKMNYEMRIEQADSSSNTVAFMHQMIPHHENAVNMAKILLKNPGDEELDEEVGGMLRDIINSQNAQITFMRSYLKDAGQEEVNLCEAEEQSDEGVPDYAIAIMVCLGVLAFVSILSSFFFRSKIASSSGSKDAAAA